VLGIEDVWAIFPHIRITEAFPLELRSESSLVHQRIVTPKTKITFTARRW
jgi:hypothetical protein